MGQVGFKTDLPKGYNLVTHAHKVSMPPYGSRHETMTK